ncbi:MAG: methyltransferase domain-containing protein [Candidatus Falkowbacteria bacterium]
MEKFSLEKIGEFSVTDRGLEQVLEDMGIKESEIDNFPKEGTVLNIGSGLYQKFEEELRNKRSDLKIVSLDPTLGIDPEDFAKGDWYIEKLGNSIAQYKLKDRPKLRWGKDMTVSGPEEFQRERLKKISQESSGCVVALAPQLPFKSESFDVIIDCVASMRYLNNEKDRKDNLISICDLLKPGGSAYITSLKKADLEVVGKNFQVDLLREYEGAGIEYCDAKITKPKSGFTENYPYLLRRKRRRSILWPISCITARLGRYGWDRGREPDPSFPFAALSGICPQPLKTGGMS